MIYKWIRPVLFGMDAEKAHHLAFYCIRQSLRYSALRWAVNKVYTVTDHKLQRRAAGLQFANPVGLAAGFDKNALLVDQWENFGFGFIEIGTVTPRPQPGNPRPRLFRLVKDKALINRMGFNNDGVDVIAQRLCKRKTRIIIGGNIGKNKDTPNDKAADDYLACFMRLHDVVDYFVVNVSSPNTPGLRDLQDAGRLNYILETLQNENRKRSRPKPVFIKIAPDLTKEQLDEMIRIVEQSEIDGVIATNTTISRAGLKSSPELIHQSGGLSGKPLFDSSTEVLRYLAQNRKKTFVLIGSGGIHSAEDAMRKFEAGAGLIQLYTGFIYEGPGLVKRINNQLVRRS